MFHHRKDEMLSAIIPIFGHLLPQIQLPTLRVDHRMINFTNENDMRSLAWKVLKGDFELELCIFVQSVSDEENPVPNLVGLLLL